MRRPEGERRAAYWPAAAQRQGAGASRADANQPGPGGRAGGPVPGTVQRLGFAILLCFLFILYSRILDFTLPFLHLPLVAALLAVTAALMSGGVQRALGHPIGMSLVALTMWIGVGIPLSVWPGGSFLEFKDQWLKSVLTYVLIAALVITFGQLRRAVHTLAWAVLVLALIALWTNDTSSGRLWMGGSRFGNPNDLAQVLVMSLPLWWSMATNGKLSRPYRALAWLSMIPILVAFMKTGSRSGLIGFAGVLLVIFLSAPPRRKLQIAIVAPLLLLIGLAVTDQSLRQRFLAFFESSESQRTTAQLEASGSSEARMALLKESIRLTLAHPLFGVGVGQFAVAQNDLAKVDGERKGRWQVTHNTYTQFSSECGLPGLFLFLAALVLAFKATAVPSYIGVTPPRIAELAHLASCIRLCLVAYALSSCFASFAYDSHFAVLAGLAASLSFAVREELRAETPPRPRASGAGARWQAPARSAGPAREAPGARRRPERLS